MKDGWRSRTLRCRVDSGGAGISSMIIKQIKEEAVRGFSDWASVAFLSGLQEARGIAPCFYGGDVAERLFLIEDLGEGTSLHDVLAGTDNAAAHAALQALASQMARLHAATMGKQELFEGIRAGLPETDRLGRQWEARQWLENLGKILEWFDALGCVPPFGFEECLRYIAGVYAQPGEFLAFTHGDPAPSNNHFVKDKACLVDFEYGGFRHALYDITGWTILCPLPMDCVREMSGCFREELAKSCSAARDGAPFEKAWACVCGYRALAMLTWIPPDIINRNRFWADDWTMREAAFVAMCRLREAAMPFAELEAVSDGAGVLAKGMRRCWPEFADAEDALPQWLALLK